MSKNSAVKAASKPMKVAKTHITKEMKEHLKSDFALGVAA